MKATDRTFLIADVRGYTTFTLERGNEAAAQLAAAFADIAREVVTGREGEVVELRGDEALAVFSSARQALYSAVEMQRRFRQHTDREPGLPLKVGIGIDAGPVVPFEEGFRGLAINLAARLCALAGPNEVYGSETVVQLAQKLEHLAYVERGRLPLKGFSEPIRIIQILPEDELPEGFPTLVSLVARPSNLPVQPTSFIGREREVAAIVDMVCRDDVRLVSLFGPGGTGKTRLALQVGAAVLDDFEWGVFFVSLAAISDPRQIAATIAATLRVKEEPQRDIAATLGEYLRSKRMMLVLDNCEHMLEGISIVADLLSACPDLTILATSRAVLHLTWEHGFPVPPLAVPTQTRRLAPEAISQYESVALFVRRAQAIRADFHVTDENALAIAEICRRLDGLPLALELAAARIRLFPPQALLGRLSSRLRLLTGGSRDLPDRQRTLRAAIDWSFSLLSGEEQALFARLSVFHGGCTLEAAEAVAGPGGDIDVLNSVSSLVEKSLLRQEGDDESRFTMLETIREYAQEQLALRGETAGSREHHAHYFLGLAEAAECHLTGAEQAVWLDRLERDQENMRAALIWARERRDRALSLSLTAALWRFWYMTGSMGEGRDWLEAALNDASEDVLDRSLTPLRAKALQGASVLAYSRGDYKQSVVWVTEALDLMRALGDRGGVATALNTLGVTARNQGDLIRATALFEEALALRRELEDPRGIAVVLNNLGTAALLAGDLDRAAALQEESLSIRRPLGDAWGVANVLERLADTELRRGNLHRSIALCEESLTVRNEIGDRHGMSLSHHILGNSMLAAGVLSRARRSFLQGLDLSDALGDASMVLSHVTGLAAVARHEGCFVQAARLMGAEAQLSRALQVTETAFGQPDFDRDVAAVRSALPAKDFETAWNEGAQLTLVQLVDEVRSTGRTN